VFVVRRIWGPVLAIFLAVPAVADQPYWQCAAFARQFSGIEIRGDAWTWWGLAEGRYERGSSPRVGAVMSFSPGSSAMRLGHVATVTRILSPRELTVTHANWSPIGGVRGQIERDVLVRDVSEAGDWSRVRVWYAPLGELGTTAWPIDGFIYPKRVRELDAGRLQIANARVAPIPAGAPRLTYARLDTLRAGAAPQSSLRLANDVMRLARLEERQGR
jgi:surface antigen